METDWRKVISNPLNRKVFEALNEIRVSASFVRILGVLGDLGGLIKQG